MRLVIALYIAVSAICTSDATSRKALRWKGATEEKASKKTPRHFPKTLKRRDLFITTDYKSTEYTASCGKGGKGKGYGRSGTVDCTCGKGYGPCGSGDDDDAGDDGNWDDDDLNIDGSDDSVGTDDKTAGDDMLTGDDIVQETADPDDDSTGDIVSTDDAVDDSVNDDDDDVPLVTTDDAALRDDLDSGSNEGIPAPETTGDLPFEDVSTEVPALRNTTEVPWPTIAPSNSNVNPGGSPTRGASISNEDQGVPKAYIPSSITTGVIGANLTVFSARDEDSGSNENL